MLKINRSKILTLLSAIALLASFNISAKNINQTIDVTSGGDLYLRTDVGRLIIDTHSRDQVILEVEIKGDDADKFEVTQDTSGNKVTILGKMESNKRWGWNRDIKAEFRLTVPEEFNLELHTSGGSIEIEDLKGNVDAHTSGGHIDVGNITGDVELKTSGGSIETKEIHGELDAHTSGGSIRVTMTKQPSKDAELSTSGGSITAYLLDDIEIDIDASTSGGRVRSEFDVDGKIKKQSIRGQINGGGPRLELHTSGGSVSIKKL
ncbi:DUF4097 family beta strand repeat-containing protein [Aliiglaciecola lipolytica]|uniref:DUF4097 domain-containing protein n=1 Tax=Aliiglaciecola lipolytica E3 TaxID=1127673 RepID=K6Y320_9ALTE|nr:DUF4097 family beta strand repeat-containing protein [Aliiglaciecola lipolytica]GAC12672.1 hypothetical protein GLIP_0017 [Aliiglaciecola lipolytica E3]